MLGYHVYQAVQFVTDEYVRRRSPKRRSGPEPERVERGVAIRARVSLTLRRLADAVEPAREAFEPAPMGGPRSSNCYRCSQRGRGA